MVGVEVGTVDGSADGAAVGLLVGTVVGEDEVVGADVVGVEVGDFVGFSVGGADGAAVGLVVGLEDGLPVGSLDGVVEGAGVIAIVGPSVGDSVGGSVGVTGAFVGDSVGSQVFLQSRQSTSYSEEGDLNSLGIKKVCVALHPSAATAQCEKVVVASSTQAPMSVSAQVHLRPPAFQCSKNVSSSAQVVFFTAQYSAFVSVFRHTPNVVSPAKICRVPDMYR